MKKAKSRLNNHKTDWRDHRLTPIIIFAITILLCIVAKLGGGIFDVRAMEIEEVEYKKPIVIEKEIVREIRIAKVTAYSCGGLTTEKEIRMNCPSLFSGSPKTSTGTTPTVNKTVACDRANTGKKFHLEGYGEVVCEDTGGAINGAGRFDLYVETVQEGYDFGVQYLEYYEIKN